MIQIKHNGEIKEVLEVYIGNTSIGSIYNKEDLLFENSSQICFSNGYWVDEFPWDDNSYWRD